MTQDILLAFIARVGVEEAAKQLKMEEDFLNAYVVEQTGREDVEFFARHKLKIRTKSGQMTSLVLNKGQKKLLDAVIRQRQAGKPVRIKLLKARQYGGSTFIQALYFHDLIYNKHKQYLTVCHDLDSARGMRAMTQRYYDHYNGPKPTYKQESDKWWKFRAKDSDYVIDTADEVDTGRSTTVHRLHASECAFYRDANTLMVSLLQAVPDDPDSIVFIESTGNGIGDWFYNFITSKNDYELVFVAWFEIEEYTRAFESDSEKIALEKSLDAYEQALVTKGLTLEQINWRRYTVSNKLNGDEQKFRQEYPATPEEAFIASGRPFFPGTKVRDELLRTQNLQLKTGFLEWKEHGKSVEFVPDKTGWWTIIEEPKAGYEFRYVTGSDSAEGKMVKEASKEPDNSVCRVFDRLGGREVAAFAARIETDLFAQEIYKASVWYHSACDCIERNSSGIAVIDALKDKPGVWLYRRSAIGKLDEEEGLEYGWQTNVASRDSLLSQFRTWVREGTYKSDDKNLWAECLTFVYDDKGKAQGQKGCHDDRVMAAALTVEAIGQANELHQITKPVKDKDVPPDADIVRTKSENVRAQY